MAEGGVAAALGHVAPADSWQVHFRDTMVGGKLLNNPRMAQLHAIEAPDRVRELELWGAVFDRTSRRPDPPAAVRRALPSAARPCRRPDRPRDDPDAPGPGGRGGDPGLHGVHGHPADHRGPGGVTGAFGYWRTTGEPIAFAAKATVLATGGIGKAYEITSNSWEYSGDGQALAYEAGAELIDMEFVQFHPTGMVWPPGVRGLLVTEAVRGEGGILRNAHGERFMWKYLPDERRAEYAETDEEAARWVTALSQGRETDARRPPELSTRDNVARAIYTEVREGRGSPHGGVFLDISYLPAEHVRRKLPSMYEQFKELADVDITRGPMEVGPDHALRHGRHPGRRGDRRHDGAGPVRRGRGRGGIARRESARRQLAVRPARLRRPGAAAATRAAGQDGEPYLDPVQIREAAEELAAPLERPDGEDPYAIQRDLQAMMQRLVGIFRVEADLDEALRELAELRRRWELVRATGGRAYNPGLEPRLRARQPADRLGGDHPQRSAADREPRRPQPARPPGHRRRDLGQAQQRRRTRRRWHHGGHLDAAPQDDRRAARPPRRGALRRRDGCPTHI